MSDLTRKRSRKTKLVPREGVENDDENVTIKQMNRGTILDTLRQTIEMDEADTVKPSTSFKSETVPDNDPEDFEALIDNERRQAETKPREFSVTIDVEEFDENSADLVIDEGCDEASANENANEEFSVPAKPSTNVSKTELQQSAKTMLSSALAGVKKDIANGELRKPFIINREDVLEKTNKIMEQSQNDADKLLCIEVKNGLGYCLLSYIQDEFEEMIQKVLEQWHNWQKLFQVKYRSTPLFYKCYMCQKSWWYLSDLKNHLKETHVVGLYQLDLEEYSLYEANIIAYKTAQDIGERKHFITKGDCPKCGSSFAVHKRTNRFTDNFYICRIQHCFKAFQTCFLQKTHENICHTFSERTGITLSTVEWKKTCEVCGLVFHIEEQYTDHMSLMHRPRSDVVVPVNSKTCKSCKLKYVYNNTHDCPTHSSTMKCTHCFRIFPQGIRFILHAADTGSIRCKVCSEVIPFKCQEVEHLMTHTDKFMLVKKCMLCADITVFSDYHGVTKKDYDEHISTHIPTSIMIKYFHHIIIPKSCLSFEQRFIEHVQMNTDHKGKEKSELKHRTLKEASPRCSNCSFLIPRAEQGRFVNLLLPALKRLLEHWIAPTQITDDSSLCKECYIILRDYSGTVKKGRPLPLPVLGHKKICYGCGRYLVKSKCKMHNVEDCPERDIILRNVPPHLVSRLKKACFRCMQIATNKIQNQKEKNRDQNEENQGQKEVNQDIPTTSDIPEEPPLCVIETKVEIKEEINDYETHEDLNMDDNSMEIHDNEIQIKQEDNSSNEEDRIIIKQELEIEDNFNSEQETAMQQSYSIKINEPDDHSRIFGIKIEPQDIMKQEMRDEESEYEDDIIRLDVNFDYMQDMRDSQDNSQDTQDTQDSMQEVQEISEDYFLIDDDEEAIVHTSPNTTQGQVNMNRRLPNIYRCSKCGYEGLHKEYKAHILSDCLSNDWLKNEFRCSKCHKIFNDIRKYQNHLASDTPCGQTRDNYHQGEYTCTKCNNKFKSFKKYLEHFSIHGLNGGACPACFKEHEEFGKLKSHVLLHIRNMYVGIRMISLQDDPLAYKFQCKQCNEKVNRKGFFKHWEEHLSLGVQKEKDEDFIFNAEDIDNELVKQLLDQLQSLPSSYAIQLRAGCIVCKKYFSRRNDFKRHLIEHLLNDAYSRKHNYQCLKCQLCNKGFMKPHNYRMHMRYHGSLPIYKCEICDKTFSDSSNFAKHKKLHNANAYTCDICGKKFQAKQSIIKHMKLHVNHKPLPCTVCNKIFNLPSALRKHTRLIHDKTNAKYGCHICSLRFMRLREKWDHMWHVHKERKYKIDCAICKKSYRRLRDLKYHMHDEHDANLKKIGLSKTNEKDGSDAVYALIQNNKIVEETLVIYE